MSDPNLPISEIAWLVGYQGVSAFSHGYKRWTGMNPKKMRGKLLASRQGRKARRAAGARADKI
ncbi:MAG TPA: AraC family transcriptional regulator [Pseudolabrys sp.]|nr:AraC family transcriptional regulator [Pseudolabrys sp.]